MRVVLRGLSHTFPGGAPLFKGVSAAWRTGDVVAITGPSGSGKSTLLSIVSGWLAPTKGTVVVPPESVIAWVFQNPYGVARRTALDHVVLPLLARGHSRESADSDARAILARFHLQDVASRRFADLSGGEALRLMLARAVARNASLILVDEPTAQLDFANAASVVDVLHELASAGAIVVIATHDERVREHATKVLDLAAYHEAA